jgi:hypothetical protein
VIQLAKLYCDLEHLRIEIVSKKSVDGKFVSRLCSLLVEFAQVMMA